MEPKLFNEAKAQLAEEGWFIVPDVISPDTAAQGLELLWTIAEANAREGYSCFLPDFDPNANMVRILTPLFHPYFRDLIQNPTALEMARAVVGQDIIVTNCTGNIATPGARPMKLHSDLAFVLPEPWLYPWSVNVLWCLSDLREENGATHYIPGSHLWQTHAEIPADATDRLVPFEARAGSIIVVDGRLWHTSGSNVTADEDRGLLFSYYSAPFLRPMINWTAILPAEDQRSFSPLLRELLSLDVFANTSGNDKDAQGHWKGMPVGVDQAMSDFRRGTAWRDAVAA